MVSRSKNTAPFGSTKVTDFIGKLKGFATISDQTKATFLDQESP